LNLHSAKYLDEKFLVVQRKDVNSFLQPYDKNRIYIAVHCFFSHLLIYLIEGNTCKIWLRFNEIKAAKSNEYFEITYKIFDLLAFWLEKGIEQIEHIICNDKPYQFHIDISFANFEKYSFEEVENIQDDIPLAKAEFNYDGYIFFTVDIAFLKVMFRPENTAEKELIAMIMEPLYSIVNNDLRVDRSIIWKITRDIFGNNNYSRRIHFFPEYNIEDILPVTKEKIILIPEEEIISVENSLDFSITDLNKQNVLQKLNALVDTLYADLIKRLVVFNKKHLIIMALENHEKIIMTSNQWNRTAAAIVASHDDPVEAQDAIKKQMSLYAKSSQASRILSEIALCQCSNTGKEISRVEMEYLLAEVFKILEYGKISDALYYDIVGIDIFGMDKGTLIFKDSTIIDTIMVKYQNTVALRELELNIERYDKLYQNVN
jgi:hypothetical protein